LGVTSSKNDNWESESYRPSRILVPIDGSPNAIRALNVGIDIARTYDAELLVLNVLPINPHRDSNYEHQEEEAHQLVINAATTAKARGISRVRIEAVRATNSIVDEIINIAARDKIELIVIGTRGLGDFRRLLLGSVSNGVVVHSQCSVLIVR
jgi:nucleotide-binding universal stress UspA family protein